MAIPFAIAALGLLGIGAINEALKLSKQNTYQTQCHVEPNQNEGERQTDEYGRLVNSETKRLTTLHQNNIQRDGNCTSDELRALQAGKDRIYNQNRSCRGLNSPKDRDEIIKRMQTGFKCATIRRKIVDKCFAEGDKTHMDQMNTVFKTASECGLS